MTCLDETTAAQLVAGQLPPATADAAREHILTCRDCEQFVAELARAAVDATAPAEPAVPASPSHVPRGTRVGRFTILERLGAGGMGVVYAASDPDLDRRIALKLLRAEVGEAGRPRLLREAQAAARLSHPNVVSIYDIGTFEGGVYLAMELVDGPTLAEWLRQPRTWQAIVDAFVQCGRGLAAAHAAGVIHRDFKPDNVIVGRDGRIRVADFGLARNTGDAPTPGRGGDARDDAKLTQTGALIGTPRFMAPEQFTGAAITPATDQFAFCVALFAALYGTQPFRGDRVSEIAAHVVAGDIAPPRAPRGPSALRRAIVRGLAGEPAQRHPSMDALVQQLARARTLRRNRALVAGALGAVATTVLVVELARGGDAAPCATSAAKITTAWTPARAAAVRTALASAPIVAATVDKRLTSYASAWSLASTAACKATHVDDEQSPAMLDLRVACLDDRLAALTAVVTELEHVDRETMTHAIEAADALPSLAVCADRKALAERVAPPDQVIASRVAQIGTQLARATTLQRLGKVAAALDLASTTCAAVDTLHYAPVTARCRYVVASLVDDAAGDRTRAIDLMSESVNAATAGNDQERVAEGALALARLLGDRAERYDEADRWLELAEGARARLVARNDIAARIASVRGLLAARRGRQQDALAQFEQVLRLADDPAGLPAARAHVSIGHTLLALDRAGEAEPHYRAALAITEELAGKLHPELLPVLDGLGNLSFARGDAAGAVPYLERSLAITRTMVAAAHPSAITAQANLGAALTNANQLDRALAELEAARAAVKPADRRELALVLTNLVPVYQQRGDTERALATARDALAVEREVKGDDHPETGIAYFNVGDTLLSAKRPKEAAEAVQKALSIWERTLPPNHPHLALARDVLAKINAVR